MKVRVHPAFIAFLFVYTLFGGLLSYLVAFLAVLAHEFSHLLIARISGETNLLITLMPYGASLRIEGETTKTAAILLAGPCGSAVAACASLAIAWLFPETYGVLKGFIRANVSVALVNLLPAYPLDGGRLLREWFPSKAVGRFTSAMTFFLALFFFALFFFEKGKNLTHFTFAVFALLYYFSFSVRRPLKAASDAPLFSIVRTDEEGSFRSVIVRDGKKRIAKLRGEDVARLILRYQRDLPIGRVLEKEKECGSRRSLERNTDL